VARRSHNRYLASSETIKLEVRHHYAVLLRPFLITLVIIVAAAGLGSLTSPGRTDHPFDTFLGLVTIGFVAWFVWQAALWWADRFVMTNERLFEVSGIFTRKVASMPLTNLTELTYRRTVLGRVLGYGDLVIETPGQDQALRHIGFVPSPDHIYRVLTGLVIAHVGGATQDAAAEAFVDRPPDDEDTGEIPRVFV
jgi:Bacterial PH domain